MSSNRLIFSSACEILKYTLMSSPEGATMADTTKSVRPGWVDDELFPFESRFVEIDGHTVHYVDEGSGPTLLFLHGNPTWSFLWRDVIRALHDDFRCIALDYPGFGLSTPKPGYRYLPEEHADVVTEFVDALGLEGVTVVGQGWGGMIGLAAVQRRPDVFDRLVLANTWAWPVNGILHFEAFGRIIGGPPIRFLVRRLNLLVNAFIPTGHRRRKPTVAENDPLQPGAQHSRTPPGFRRAPRQGPRQPGLLRRGRGRAFRHRSPADTDRVG
ncbi:alpha/beta fold hydrolase [Nocardia sp. NPDC056952]|uniref:alpha/beta fold hydrolase n=1 Tax=Nocardia sp. NPDC056952 TaxID=3345979 RepID=UPI003634940D